MLSSARVKQTGAAAVVVDVVFRRPGQVLAVGVVSLEYEIEYQTADLAKLVEGDAVVISTEKFKVRTPPLPQGDGYFSVATLTRT